jgi:hypothetical protein
MPGGDGCLQLPAFPQGAKAFAERGISASFLPQPTCGVPSLYHPWACRPAQAAMDRGESGRAAWWWLRAPSHGRRTASWRAIAGLRGAGRGGQGMVHGRSCGPPVPSVRFVWSCPTTSRTPPGASAITARCSTLGQLRLGELQVGDEHKLEQTGLGLVSRTSACTQSTGHAAVRRQAPALVQPDGGEVHRGCLPAAAGPATPRCGPPRHRRVSAGQRPFRKVAPAPVDMAGSYRGWISASAVRSWALTCSRTTSTSRPAAAGARRVACWLPVWRYRGQARLAAWSPVRAWYSLPCVTSGRGGGRVRAGEGSGQAVRQGELLGVPDGG